MPAAGDGADGARLRSLIVILWRAGLRISEALNVAETEPIFDAIGSKTVRLQPDARGVSRLKLVAAAWTAGIVASLRAQLSRGR